MTQEIRAPGLRPMVESDLTGILELDSRCQGSPWTKGHFLDEMGREDNGFCRVIEGEDGFLAGYICAWTAADEVSIGTVGVDPAARRRGWGRTLVDAAHRWARDRGATVAHLEVRRGNQAALALYGALGYRQVGVRRAYYADNGEDALLLLADLA